MLALSSASSDADAGLLRTLAGDRTRRSRGILRTIELVVMAEILPTGEREPSPALSNPSRNPLGTLTLCSGASGRNQPLLTGSNRPADPASAIATRMGGDGPARSKKKGRLRGACAIERGRPQGGRDAQNHPAMLSPGFASRLFFPSRRSRPVISTLPSSVSCRRRSLRSATSSSGCAADGRLRGSAPASPGRR